MISVVELDTLHGGVDGWGDVYDVARAVWDECVEVGWPLQVRLGQTKFIGGERHFFHRRSPFRCLARLFLDAAVQRALRAGSMTSLKRSPCLPRNMKSKV